MMIVSVKLKSDDRFNSKKLFFMKTLSKYNSFLIDRLFNQVFSHSM